MNDIQKMFDKISSRYDLLNNLISFGLHKIVKKDCIKSLEIKAGEKVLDLCTGTGDMANFEYKYSKNVIGVDFSENMLKIAKSKFPKIEFINCDCTNLPFKDNAFDIITIAYGLRNISNKEKLLQEIYRILKPQGKFLHLDFGEKNIFIKFFDFITPFIAKIFSKDENAYKYLINSIENFYTPNELVNFVTSRGFSLNLRKDYIFKSISSQVFIKNLDK